MLLSFSWDLRIGSLATKLAAWLYVYPYGGHSWGRTIWLQIRVCDLLWVNFRWYHQAEYNFPQVKVSLTLEAALGHLSCCDVMVVITGHRWSQHTKWQKGYMVWKSGLWCLNLAEPSKSLLPSSELSIVHVIFISSQFTVLLERPVALQGACCLSAGLRIPVPCPFHSVSLGIPLASLCVPWGLAGIGIHIQCLDHLASFLARDLPARAGVLDVDSGSFQASSAGAEHGQEKSNNFVWTLVRSICL